MSEARERPTILVTGAAGPAGRALAEVLGRLPAESRPRAVGVDLAPVPVDGLEVVEPVPAADAPDYDRAMLDLVARHRPHLVVPTVSEELPRLAVLGAATGLAGRGLVLSAPGPVSIAADKLLTMWALARGDVPVPRHAAVGELASAEEALRWAGGPVVVKPRVSRGGRGVHVVESPDDPAWETLDDACLVQAFAGGVEYSPQVHRSPRTGRCLVVVLEKTGRKQGRVGNATSVVRLAGDDAPDVAKVARRTVETLDLVGPVDLDVRRLADGTPVVLEVNSRFGAVSTAAPELLDAVLDEWGGTVS